jgi:hypothetical protein
VDSFSGLNAQKFSGSALPHNTVKIEEKALFVFQERRVDVALAVAGAFCGQTGIFDPCRNKTRRNDS